MRKKGWWERGKNRLKAKWASVLRFPRAWETVGSLPPRLNLPTVQACQDRDRALKYAEELEAQAER